MKILYVSQYYPPEMGAPAARAAELAGYWTEDGHEVTVLTGFPNHPTGIVPPEYRGKFRRLVAREDDAGIDLVRTWLFPLPNRKAYERILNHASFCVSASATGLFLSRPDVVIATSPQLLVGLAGWWLARWKKVPFVFEVRDLWPESLAAVGMGEDRSPLHRSLSRITGFLYRVAQQIVVVSPAFRDYLVNRWHLPPDKIFVVENGVETDLFRPSGSSPYLRSRLGAEDKFLVSYIGTMGMAHGLETLVETAEQLQRSAPHVLFVLVGEGAEKENIASLVRARRLTNVRFVDQQPRELIPAYINASDACLVLLKKRDVFRTVIPTKMLEFMACGRPVVLGVDGQARSIIERAESGIFVEPENPAALARTILHLAGNSDLRAALGRNGRRFVLQHFSRQQTAKLYLDLLESLIGRERQPCLAA